MDAGRWGRPLAPPPPSPPLDSPGHAELRRALGSIAINGPAFCFEFPRRGRVSPSG